MTASYGESQRRIRDYISIENAERTSRILADFTVFITWLRNDLPDIYHNVSNRTQELWSWLKSQF
jgi:hypothetical protein